MHRLDYKRIALIVAVVASSTLTWAVARAWLEDPARFSDLLTMLWPALAFVLASAVTALAFMLQKHQVDRLAATLASWATFTFFWAPDIWYVSALPVFLAFWWFASRDMQHDLSDRHTVRVSTTLGHGMKLVLLGLFLMVSLGFYLLPSQRLTVGTVSKSLQSSVADSPFIQQQLPPGSQAAFDQYVDQAVRTWLAPVKKFIPPLLAFGLFLTLWSLNFILRVPAVWLGNGLFLGLKRAGFVQVAERDIKGEVIEL